MSLSSHVLDVTRGIPAADIPVTLFLLVGDQRVELAQSHTDADGRIAAPFGGELLKGYYELLFSVLHYFKQSETPSFYEEIPIRFRIDDPQRHYHVPLLLSPWSYSSYRGS